MVFPFVWQLIASISTQAEITSIPPSVWPASPQWTNFPDVFDKLPNFASQFGVSVVTTVLRVGAQLVLCCMAGYAFARLDFRFKNVLFGLTLAILMVPPQLLLVSQYQVVLSLGLINTIAGIVAPNLFNAFGVFLMRQFFMSIPHELEEAALLDGANRLQVFVRVMVPLAVPGLSALAVIGVLASWNDLLWPLVVSTRPEVSPLTVGLASLQGLQLTDTPVLMAASLLASLPILILFIVLQRRVIDGLAHSGMK